MSHENHDNHDYHNNRRNGIISARRLPPDGNSHGELTKFASQGITPLDPNRSYVETHLSEASYKDGSLWMKLSIFKGITPYPMELVATKEVLVDPVSGEMIGQVIDQGEWDKEYLPTRWNGEWVWTHLVPPIEGVFTDAPKQGHGRDDIWLDYL